MGVTQSVAVNQSLAATELQWLDPKQTQQNSANVFVNSFKHIGLLLATYISLNLLWHFCFFDVLCVWRLFSWITLGLGRFLLSLCLSLLTGLAGGIKADADPQCYGLSSLKIVNRCHHQGHLGQRTLINFKDSEPMSTLRQLQPCQHEGHWTHVNIKDSEPLSTLSTVNLCQH